MSVRVEVCVADIAQAVAANECEVDSLEVCSAIELDGLTPSIGLVEVIKAECASFLRALVRPRGGNFAYSSVEKKVMLRDIAALIAGGVDGIVVGGLTGESKPDLPFIEQCRRAAPNVELTFHRAYDLLPASVESLTALVDAGVDRLLTSGGEPSVVEGTRNLQNIQTRAKQLNLKVAAGGGVSSVNVETLVKETGIEEIHFSARMTDPDSSHDQSIIPGLDQVPDQSKIRGVLQVLTTAGLR